MLHTLRSVVVPSIPDDSKIIREYPWFVSKQKEEYTPPGAIEYKYSLSNAREDEFGLEDLVRMQSQQYFIERSFQDAKQEAGMSEYQVRDWRAWHHHMVLVILSINKRR